MSSSQPKHLTKANGQKAETHCLEAWSFMGGGVNAREHRGETRRKRRLIYKLGTVRAQEMPMKKGLKHINPRGSKIREGEHGPASRMGWYF